MNEDEDENGLDIKIKQEEVEQLEIGDLAKSSAVPKSVLDMI